MSEITFKKGDVVVLKSGGQSMTIDSFVWNKAKEAYFTDKVECIWFNGKDFNREIINTSSLEPE